MANPRKFSEKIALHNQKQADETAAFEKIMKEVSAATQAKSDNDNSDQLWAVLSQAQVLQPIPQPPQQMMTTKQQQNNLLSINASFRGGSLPNVNQIPGDTSPTSRMGAMFNQPGTSPRSSRNSIGPLRVSKTRVDHAPYASPPNLSMLHSAQSGNLGSTGLVYGVNYLSPPMENAAWRRANSDSALNSLMIPSVVPDSSEESSNNSNDPRENYIISIGKTNDSPNQLPNTVGDGPNLLEIPTSVSTGSLPDLTTFHSLPFNTSLQQSVDMEDQQLNHSSYSTSPVTYSPSMSPHPPSQQSNQQQQQQQQQSPSQSQGSPQQQQQQQGYNKITLTKLSQQQMLDNPLHVTVSSSFQNYPNNEMLTTYRCPPRPSPQNSPLPFRSPSPLDGHLSAPPSPTTQPSQNSPENFFVNQQLQQHFEQISMMESTPGRNNGHNSWQGGGMANNQYFYNQAQQIQTGATAVTAQQSPQHPQPQTPQTPSSIPDIIFTDFSDVHSTEPLDEFLASEAAAQALREGLGPIDLEGLNILAHPELVPLDPQAEDTFRLDRL